MKLSTEARTSRELEELPRASRVGSLRKGIAGGAVVLLLAGSLPAAEHIVPRTRLHDAVAANQSVHRENRAELMRLLSRPESRSALTTAGLEFRRVEQAIASLDAETAARLAERARGVNQDFAAGALSNQMLTYIVIALGTAIIVLVAVT